MKGLEQPGLVLGLDRGGACRGIGYRVAAADRPERVAGLMLVAPADPERFSLAGLRDGNARPEQESLARWIRDNWPKDAPT